MAVPKENRTIVIIPAKGYSRRVPHKNMRILAGKPLLQYTLERSLHCPLVSDVYVSTDSAEIAAFATSVGAKVPFLRNPSLSGDAVHGTEPVLDMLERIVPEPPEDMYCVRILAPFPFLSAKTLQDVITQSRAEKQNVLSVARLDLNMYHLKTLEGERKIIRSVAPNVPINFQIDDAPELFALSGAAQCAPVIDLLRHRTYQYGSPIGYPISKTEGFELDTLEAFELAERIKRAESLLGTT